MKKKVFFGLLVIVMTLAVATAGCTSSTNSSSGGASPSAPTITQTAASTPDLSQLVSFLKQANLTETLNNTTTNYTLFAPDNAAFAMVNASTLANLQNNTTALTNLLLYHIVPTKLFESNFTGSGTLTTVNGLSLPYSVNGTTLKVDNAMVTKADINATNGVIHVIDSVLVPP